MLSASSSANSNLNPDFPLTLPLPSIFQNSAGAMNPSLLFNPPTTLTPSFLLPSNPSMMQHNFGQDIQQNYMDMPNMVDQFQMGHHQGGHGATHHYSPAIQYPYLYLQHSAAQHVQQQQQQNHVHPHMQQTSASPSTPTKSVKRKHSTTSSDKKSSDPLSPNTVPKCTRCNETASWRHDKRRWWCKECKKAFTPGISKQQNTNASSPSAQVPQLQAGGWEQTQPNSSQNTPPSVPQNPNMVTPVSCNCPNCGAMACWKHDKKRWYCRDCKKPFTPPGDVPTSPKSSKKSSKAKKASPSLQQPQVMMTTASPSQSQIVPNPLGTLPPFHQQMQFPSLPPLMNNQKELTMPNTMRTQSSGTPPSIPSPSSIINVPNGVNQGQSSPSKKQSQGSKKKDDKVPNGDGLQVLVSVDNTLADLGRGQIMGDISDYSKMSMGSSKFLPDLNRFLPS
ncbi:hypothetical protein SAMD00019534_062190 [Acytostelium subglobosum LB1]|uniref:hypothetical protein n=1 Tax=Acytostelium subglobosum LB1 TaxID=1410327 RepID=UPI00064496C8|nr:hypothetical protein SAMD00019534_062190 [Acytostelium subglobosum LB1]GAM23044.1 hypothetical protein SAMD00019534_062190 [Acytostelium subglobosum LB1]|eukprot:XP_012754271.1 hypothetical protein SAMD00019534_062190 [Acytostelium subglobosum LB1]